MSEPRACFCIGPQNGEPHCPCRMRELQGTRPVDLLKKPMLKKPPLFWRKIASIDNTYERYALVDVHGEIYAEIQGLWPLGQFEYNGRRFIDKGSAQLAAEKDHGQ